MATSRYFNKHKVFSVRELLYRIRQFVRNRFFDRLAEDDFGVSLPIPDCTIINNEDAHKYYPIFESCIDIYKEIDWHLDVSTGKRFPQSFEIGRASCRERV